ncbi:hypothetical protein TWF569_009900 [Orbilia oligospora]|uniref:Flavin-nucleotide-binding protein n=1 Tax=Orbilia oligospora TaxID=2813651 RepID=A0A7C8J9Q7_ORBOL|nr:hypothetical protein TWF102_006857 [Orbilia oligospora]KAF3105507.1 hypothetical protein TWF103_006575 [Orbilia oligospora]KAF3135560.1 hypothetical protein TWF569_009900 [Orbilia oligospora]KAF3172847.1 hypothetical protein TWF751_005582 [Orbilia oligospora]KAF3186874.1 hypothetical protein TWF225_004492 [Orbilia oligospora]
MSDLSYPKSKTNKVNRLGERGKYDCKTVHEIIASSPVLHVSFNTASPEDFPVVLPMIGKLGSFENPSADLSEPLDLYLHGYVSSRIMNLARSSTKENSSLKVCVCATKVDGLVLSLTPNSHSMNYRSSVVFGTVSLVTELDEKLYAMKLITDGVLAGRYEKTRVPPDGAEMSSTQILRVSIESASAKVRAGEPGDYDKDLKQEELLDRVWTGVIPMYTTYGEPQPSNYNRVKEVPEYISNYVKDTGATEREYALAAITMDEAGTA